jgi:hypothetical protein
LAITISSVKIHNLNVVGIPVDPAEAQRPLAVDSDAVLAFPIACQSFKAIARRSLEVT